MAYCIQNSGIDTAGYINGLGDYLICLHNQQASDISDLADTVNRNAQISNSNADTVDMRLQTLESEISLLQDEIRRLKAASP
jgi:hypothetical protein